MKLHFCFLWLLVFCSSHVVSQSKFGNATKEELEMTAYPNDTTASAVVLLNEGETYFTYDANEGQFKFEYTQKMKIKILKTEGLSEWTNHQIRYFSEDRLNREQIKSLSGTTYNIEGGKIVKTKLSKEYIFDEDVNNRIKLKKFTLPAAKVGSVVEFKYTISSPFFYDLRDFYFQKSAPVQSASYELIIPEYYRYNVSMKGYEAIETKKTPENISFVIGGARTVSAGAEKYLFKGQDIPALKDEPYLWSLGDYVTKVSFELQSIQYPNSMFRPYSSTWENIDKKVFESDYHGGNLKKAGLFKDDIEKGELTLDNANRVLQKIKDKAKWNDVISFYPTDLKKALKDGLANSSGMNYLLINGLKAAGFEAYPVLLSTRSNGNIPQTYPSLSAFNNVITALKIDTVYYYADASDKYGTWNVLPPRSMVTQARILQQPFSSWVDLSEITHQKGMIRGELKFEDSKYKGTVTESIAGLAARSFKQDYNTKKSDDDFIEKMGNDMAGTVSDFKFEEIPNSGGSLNISYTLEKEGELGDDFLYITPLIHRRFSENPFKTEHRKFPINFDALMTYVQVVSIEIPEGYAVDELPSQAIVKTENNGLVLVYKIAPVGNAVQLHYSLKINKLLFLPTEYDMVKDFFGKVISKNTEQIVLKKIAN